MPPGLYLHGRCHQQGERRRRGDVAFPIGNAAPSHRLCALLRVKLSWPSAISFARVDKKRLGKKIGELSDADLSLRVASMKDISGRR